MILRHLALRHGRKAIARPASPFRLRQWQRSISSQSAKRASSDTFSEADEAFLSVQADPIVADFEFKNHQHALTSKTGADRTKPYNPMDLIANPVKPQDITLELLMASQTHLGHHTSLWHPGNARHIHGIWGEKHDAIHIISLDATAAHLRRACKVMHEVTFRGGLILFVGTRKGQALSVVRAAQLAGACHLFDWWKPGTITNAHSILGKCATKVLDMNDGELSGFEPQLRNRAALVPDLVVCLNPLENNVLLTECGQANIPTIGIVDTDCNPTWVTYAIPANDDSQRSVSVIAGALGQAAREGLEARRLRGKSGHVDFIPATGLREPTQEEIDEAKRTKTSLSTFDVEEDEYEIEVNRSQILVAHSDQVEAGAVDAAAVEEDSLSEELENDMDNEASRAQLDEMREAVARDAEAKEESQDDVRSAEQASTVVEDLSLQEESQNDEISAEQTSAVAEDLASQEESQIDVKSEEESSTVVADSPPQGESTVEAQSVGETEQSMTSASEEKTDEFNLDAQPAEEVEQTTAPASQTNTADIDLEAQSVEEVEQSTAAASEAKTDEIELDVASEDNVSSPSEPHPVEAIKQNATPSRQTKTDDIDFDPMTEYNVGSSADVAEEEAKLLTSSKAREAERSDVDEVHESVNDSQDIPSNNQKDEKDHKDEKSKD